MTRITRSLIKLNRIKGSIIPSGTALVYTWYFGVRKNYGGKNSVHISCTRYPCTNIMSSTGTQIDTRYGYDMFSEVPMLHGKQ